MPNHQATCMRNTVGGIPEDSPVPFTFLGVLDSRRTDTFVFIPLDTGSSGTTPSWWRLRSLRQQVCTAVTYMHPSGFYATIGKPVSYSVKTSSSTTEHDPLTPCTEDLWGLFKLAVLAGDGSNPANMEHGLPSAYCQKNRNFPVTRGAIAPLLCFLHSRRVHPLSTQVLSTRCSHHKIKYRM